MSLYDYRLSAELVKDDYPFYALIMTAMRRADSDNLEKLRLMFPDVWTELQERYYGPGGAITQEELNALERERENRDESDDVF